MTSLVATWLSQNTQARTQQIIEGKNRRQDLYKAFIEEASQVYGDALVSDNVDMSKLVGLYAMTARMRILSAPAVAANAERVIHLIAAMNFAPNLTLRELHEKASSDSGELLDPLRQFSEACRADLIARGII